MRNLESAVLRSIQATLEEKGVPKEKASALARKHLIDGVAKVNKDVFEARIKGLMVENAYDFALDNLRNWAKELQI